MWYQGGRKVFSATSQRSGKMTKSMFAVPGALFLLVGVLEAVKGGGDAGDDS